MSNGKPSHQHVPLMGFVLLVLILETTRSSLCLEAAYPKVKGKAIPVTGHGGP
jgi:hypothetical protein